MKKRIFYTEAAYVFGLLFLALGTALMEKADFGMSMVSAPAYVIYLKVSQILPFFSFGMAQYTLQAVLLIIMVLMLRKFKVSYLFSFATAVIFGFVLDGSIWLVSFLPAQGLGFDIIYYLLGMVICAAGVSLLFHTYISPEVYELFVKEISAKMKMDINKFKTIYDCASCLIGIGLSFAFFGLWHFEGVKLGTVICALVNGTLIGWCTHFFEKNWVFADGLKMRKYFSD